MPIEGIWTSEVYGPFGWEAGGVFVFEDGRIMGGDDRQYTVGSYEIDGGRVTAELVTHYYGPPRTVFGQSREEFATQIVGNWHNGVIEGSIRRAERPMFDLQIRLSKRMNLPEGHPSRATAAP